MPTMNIHSEYFLYKEIFLFHLSVSNPHIAGTSYHVGPMHLWSEGPSLKDIKEPNTELRLSRIYFGKTWERN